MPETNYAPDPRASLHVVPSRNFGSMNLTGGGSSGSSSSSAGLFEDSTGIYDAFHVDMFEDYTAGAITALDGGLGWATANGRVQNGTIVSRTTHGSVAQKRLSLVNGQYARSFAFGAKWNAIRIGILARINGAATLASRLAFGVCNGVDNVYNDATCNNFSGMVTGYDQGTTDDWTLSNRTQGDVFLSGAHENVWRRSGSADTAVAGSFSTNPVAFPATEANLNFYFVDIVRPVFTGNTAITYSHYIWTSGTAAKAEFHISRMTWRQFMLDREGPTQSTTNTGIVQAGTAGAFDTASVTETTGVFDSMCLWWENATSALEIAAIGVVKFN